MDVKLPHLGEGADSGTVVNLFVKEGDSIQKGTVVCIVEAMKLMNEIESEVAGRIVRVVAENGKPVEFGQPLFLVEPV